LTRFSTFVKLVKVDKLEIKLPGEGTVKQRMAPPNKTRRVIKINLGVFMTVPSS
jgi:hypothetical protein